MTLVLLILVAIWVLADLLSLMGLVYWIPSMSRTVYLKVRGYIDVPVPDDLHTAWANGLIRDGDELVVGYQHEGNGDHVTRFAVDPGHVGRPVGARLRVVRIGRKRLVLEEL